MKRAVCNQCGFGVPYPLDPVGVALMDAHLHDAHGVRIPKREPLVPAGTGMLEDHGISNPLA